MSNIHTHFPETIKRPLVSIITPCFNSARFIEDCLKSVQMQSYEHIEHIVQDGASADSTVDILRRYSETVDWRSEPDQGQSEGLDRALKRCHGDILFVLNADDMLLPHAASWAVKQMARFPDDAVIYGDLFLINEENEITGEFFGPEYDFPSILCVEKVIPAQAAFIRRSAMERVGLGADLALDSCPDFEMFVRLGLKFPMRHVSGHVAKYRYYLRPMDGATPRSVRRFINAKSAVMERVFQSPDASLEIKGLKRRAKVGLYLWAAEEARQVHQLRVAWEYYAQAVAELCILGRILAMGIGAYLALRKRLPRRTGQKRTNPSIHRAAMVGMGLAQDTPEIRSLLRLKHIMEKVVSIAMDISLILFPMAIAMLILFVVAYALLLLLF